MKFNTTYRNQRIKDFFETNFKNNEKIECFNCQTGYCCKKIEALDVSIADIKAIKPYIKNKHRKKAKKIFRERKINPKSLFDCPFLNKNNRCEIYNIRPIGCSTYYTAMPKEDCKDPYGLALIVDPIIIVQSLRLIEKKEKKIILDIDTKQKYDILDIFK